MLTPCTTHNDENSRATCSNPAPETAGGYNPNRMARAAQQLRSCGKLAPSGPSVQRRAECSAQPSHPTSITSAGAERLAFVHEGSARQGYLPSRAIRRGMRRLAKLGGKIRERSSFPDSLRLPPRESQALEAACPCFGFELTARSASLPGIELRRSEDFTRAPQQSRSEGSGRSDVTCLNVEISPVWSVLVKSTRIRLNNRREVSIFARKFGAASRRS